MTQSSYDYYEEFKKIKECAEQNNIKVESTSENIDNIENMFYTIELEGNISIGMQKKISYDYAEEEQEDNITITRNDKNYSVAFIIYKSKYKNKLYVITMKNNMTSYESAKQLSIEPHAFYSLAKVTGDRKKDYNKTIINTKVEDKYMKLIDEFIRYISKKDNINISNGYTVIREEIASIVENMTEPYKLEYGKVKQRTKK